MKNKPAQDRRPRIDIPSMEADMAFFEARISLADHAPDTSYQRAQVKAYQTLGKLVGEALTAMRTPGAGSSSEKNAAA